MPLPTAEAGPTTWQLTPQNLAAIDDVIDKDGIYAKGYWQEVDGKLTVVGLRIGSGESRQVAFYGDQITRHPDGIWVVQAAPKRIRRRRVRGWRLPGNAVIVSRPSRWGNPCKVGLMQEMGYHDPHAAAADNFRRWLAGSRFDAPTDEADRRRERILADLHLLRGKDLACTCPPDKTCHADVLLHLANMPAAELDEWIRGVRARVDWHRVNDGDQPLHRTP